MAALVSTIEAGVVMLTTLFDISASIADFMYREVTRNPREAVESAIRVLGYAASRFAVGKFIEQDELRVFYKRPEELTCMALSMLRKEVTPLRSDDTKEAELEKMVTAQNAQMAAKDALISQLRSELAGAKAGLGSQVVSATQEVEDALAQEMNRTVDQLKRTTEQLTHPSLIKQQEELEDLRHQVSTLNKERDELVGALHAAVAKHQGVLADLNEQVAVLRQRLEAQSAQLQQQEVARLELRREALRPAVELIAAPLQPKNSEWDDLLVRARKLKTASMWTRAHEVPPSAAHTIATAAVVKSSELSQLQQQQQQQGHRSSRGATAAAVTPRALEAVTPVYHAGGECRLLDQSAPAGSTTSNTRFEDIDTLYQVPKMPMGCYT